MIAGATVQAWDLRAGDRAQRTVLGQPRTVSEVLDRAPLEDADAQVIEVRRQLDERAVS